MNLKKKYRIFSQAVEYWRKCGKCLWGALLVIIGTVQVDATTIAAGNKSAFFIDSDGVLFGWGANGSGQLGNTATTSELSPIIIDVGPWRTLGASLTTSDPNQTFEGHTLAIKDNGTLWAWGDNSRGQLGAGDTASRSSPVKISSASNWVAVAAGSAFSMALNDDGKVFVWGDNSAGQLGVAGSANNHSVPTMLPDKEGASVNNDKFIDIAAGVDYALAVHEVAVGATYGPVYVWGNNDQGQLGLGHETAVVGIKRLPGAINWRSVEAGLDASFAISSSYQLYAWGYSGFGALGTDSTNTTNIQQKLSPTLVDTLGRIIKTVSAGVSHTLAVSTGGELLTTGQNSSGQLGQPLSIYNTFQPLQPALAGVQDAQAGNAFSLLLLADGSVLSAGSNDRGQLGNGSTTASNGFTLTSLGAVDLTIDSITIISDTESISQGDTLVFDIIVRNLGTGKVEAGTAGDIRVALSPQTIFDAEGQVDFENLTVVPLNAEIPAGSAVSVRVSGELPPVVSSGDYRILAAVDVADVLEESDENNNMGASQQPDGVLSFLADLIVALDESTLPSTIEAGQSFDLDVEFSNVGSGSLLPGVGSSFEYRLILSEQGDDLVGANFELVVDTTLSELPFVSGLLAGAAPERRTIRVTVPEGVTLGDYFVGIIVDSGNQIDELNEGNNTSFSALRDLEVTGLTIREALDLAVGAEPTASLVTGGMGNWFGKIDTTVVSPLVGDGLTVNDDSLSSPSLAAGQFSSLTFTFDGPQEVKFRWKAETSSSQNRIFFGANRVPFKPESRTTPEFLSGIRDWNEVSFIVPADTPVGFFYEQGLAADGDRVFIDELRVNPVNKPDYVVDEIEYEIGSYMLRRDSLTVTVSGLNRGQSFDITDLDNFHVTIWLSRDQIAGDANDVLLGDLDALQVLNQGTEFVYRATFDDLPEDLQDADYYVLARVDSANAVEEYNEATPFSDLDNNFIFSEEPGVSITRAADLRVTRFTGNGETPIFVGGPADSQGYDPDAQVGEQTIFGTFYVDPLTGEKSELQISFDVVNEGLSPVEAQDYTIRIFMAPSRETPPEEAFTLFEFTESAGLAQNQEKTFEITTTIPTGIEVGQFYYVGVQVDALNQVIEDDEFDNVTRSEKRNVFVGEVPLEVALNDVLSDPAILEWEDGFPGTLLGSDSSSPWFGQKQTVQFDSAEAAAAQSGPVPIGGKSEMQTEITVGANASQLISFYWKVSSQLDQETGQFDTLTYSVSKNNGPFEVVAGPIAGQVDWTFFSHILEQGDYRLRWTYQESGDGVRARADAGWVDNFSAIAPDFVASDFEVTLPVAPAPATVAPGDSLPVSFELQNEGTGDYSNVHVQIRLVPQTGTVDTLDWRVADAGDIVLLSQRVDISTLENPSVFTSSVVIPASLSISGDYFIGLWVDDALAIAESNESNNLQFLTDANQRVSIVVPRTIDQALDTDVNPWVSDTREWNINGNKAWFAFVDSSASAPADDYLTIPNMAESENAILERVIEGPKILRFRWKESSPAGAANRIFFEINGLPSNRDFDASGGYAEAGSFFSIGQAGDDFVTESVLIPAGLQTIRFRYEVRDQTGVALGTAAIDNMEIIDIPSSDVTGEADYEIQSVSFNPAATGDEDLQVYALERDSLPIEILAINRGLSPVSVTSDIEIEVRLSADQEFSSDDYVLGSLAPEQMLDGGRRLFYSGELDLPLDIVPERYYLLLRIQALNGAFQEITLDTVELLSNNVFVSESDSVKIIRLPRLVVRATNIENEKVYYPKESVRFAWELENIGLGDISAESGLTQTVELWAFPPGTDEYVFGNAEKILDVAEVVENGALNGRLTAENPLQSTITYSQVYRLPSQARLMEALGIDGVTGTSEDLSPEVLQKLSEIEGYEFFFVLQRDTQLEQSSSLAITALTEQRFVVSPFPYRGEFDLFGAHRTSSVDYELWQEFQSTRFSSVGFGSSVAVTLPSRSPTAPFPGTSGNSEIPNLYYYAFNLPLLADLSESAYDLHADADGVAFGNTRLLGEAPNFESAITFPIIRGATDLRYVVQVQIGGAWQEYYSITPPYLDSNLELTGGYVGNASLTEAGSGLLADVEVTAVKDNNYSATVTVSRDGTDALRVVLLPLGLNPLEQFVFNQLNSAGGYDIRRVGPFDDRDGDGVSNIAELQLGTDPRDSSSGNLISELSEKIAERFATDYAIYGDPAPLNLGVLDDFDVDGTSNLAEFQLGTDPTNVVFGDTVSPVAEFVAERFAIDFGVFEPSANVRARIAPNADYDGDGDSNILELQFGTDPTDPGASVSASALERFVAENLALRYNVFAAPAPSDIGPLEDLDGDNVSNIAELNRGTDPTDNSDGLSLVGVEAFVAERFAIDYSLYGDPAPGNLGALNDRDGDGSSNLAELQLGTNPIDPVSGNTISALEAYVAERFAFDYDVYASPAPTDLGLFDDQDGDSLSNLAEIQLGSDPADLASGGLITLQQAFVAEQFGLLGEFDPLPPLTAPLDDFDFDGSNNLSELQLGSDPTDPDDSPAASPTQIQIALRIAESGFVNTENDPIFAQRLKLDSDFDSDGESNLLEFALGGDLASDASQSPNVEVQMVGSDFIVTYVRLVASEQPANLNIVAECALTLTGPWAAVPAVGSSEALNADQSGLLSVDYERIDLTINTTLINCPFVRISVDELP